MRPVRISYLVDYPEHIRQLAQWLLEEWDSILGEKTPDARIKKLRAHLNRDTLPIAWVHTRVDNLSELLPCAFTILRDAKTWVRGWAEYLSVRSFLAAGLAHRYVPPSRTPPGREGCRRFICSRSTSRSGIHAWAGHYSARVSGTSDPVQCPSNSRELTNESRRADAMMTRVRRCRVTIHLVVILSLTLLAPRLTSAKRIAPAKVEPVIYQGIRYVAPNDDRHRGYIEAWNVATNHKLWELTLFTNRIDPNLEEDVQWVFIKGLSIQDGRLMVTSEREKSYQVDVNTKAITQSDSLLSPSPGAIRDMPNEVKRALTNGSAGKEYDLSFRMKPSYLEGDFNGDGKMDVAVLVKERSTGKLGIAIVDGTTEKVTLLGAGNSDRQRWR
jgi:hypothetical protein